MCTNKIAVGKYVLAEWESKNGPISRELHLVTSETKKHFIAGSGRYPDYDIGEGANYYYLEQYKFRKTSEPPYFARSIGNLTNTNGVMKYTVIEDFTQLALGYSLHEVFGADLRDIQHKEDSPLIRKQSMFDLFSASTPGLNEKELFKINLIDSINNENSFYTDTGNKLKELFKVDHVLFTFDFIREKHQTLLTKTRTKMWLDADPLKPKINHKDKMSSCFIYFWRFDKTLIYNYNT